MSTVDVCPVVSVHMMVRMTYFRAAEISNHKLYLVLVPEKYYFPHQSQNEFKINEYFRVQAYTCHWLH